MCTKIGLKPISDEKSRILILGSLPGDESLEAEQYYANPGNHFWRILSKIYQVSVEQDYESRLVFLSDRGIALWDVLQSAKRYGSRDSAIKSPVVNDLEDFIRKHPQITAIGLNGTKASKEFKKHWDSSCVVSERGIHVHSLPSSSSTPGRYVKPFDEKVQHWLNFFKPVC